MAISRPHAAWLREHAVDPEVARNLGVFTAKVPSDLPTEFRAGLGKHLPGLVFPWSGSNGHVEYQLHPDDPPVGEGGRPRKYLFRSRKNGFSGVLWAGPRDPAADRILLVEGTKQFLAAVCWAPPGSQVYGLAGVHMWTDEQVPVSDLALFTGKDVVVIFDGDAKTNRQVFDAGVSLREALEAEGAQVKFARTPTGDLDDLLAAKDPAQRPGYIERLATHAKTKPADRRPQGIGKRKAAGSETLPDPNNPMAVARVIEPDHRQDEVLVRRFWRGDWYDWNGDSWQPVPDRTVRSALYHRTEHAAFKAETSGGTQYLEWSPNKAKIANLVEALSAIMLLDTDREPPVWLQGAADPGPVISLASGLLIVDGRKQIKPDPRYFNLVSLPFEYDPDAACPKWEQFLAQLWPDGGAGSIAALQEWFGYMVSGRADFHKMMAITGPPRSGKGTIADTLTELVGLPNQVGPTMASFANTFGMQPLIGKTLAVIGDARIGPQNRDTVVERLLTISGQDTISVERKYRETWTGKIAARVMILSNDPLRFTDVSGTIASRFLALRTERSFLGKEDRGLREKFRDEELPGILNWALEGLDRLLDQGYFTEPEGMAESLREMRYTASPVSEFVDELCVVGPDYQVETERVWQAWQQWCLRQGRERTSTQAYLSRDLGAVIPGLRKIRGRGPGGRTARYEGLGLREDYPDTDPDPPSQPMAHDIDNPDRASHLHSGPRGDMSDLRSLPQSDPSEVTIGHDDLTIVRVTGTSLSGTGTRQGSEEETRSKKNNNGEVIMTYGDLEQGPARALTREAELVFDIETASSDELYSYGSGFFRIGGTKTGDQIDTGPDVEPVLQAMHEAGLISGHNIMAFDLPALVKHHDGLSFGMVHQWAAEGRLFDTILAARQDDPPMAREKGVDHQRKYDMASLAAKFELGAKTDQLKQLAKQHGGFDAIPLDHPEYHDYLRNDLEVSQGLLDHYRDYVTDSYLQREHRVAALAAQFRHNGFRVDLDLLAQRVRENAELRDKAMRWLVKNCGIPLTDPQGKPYKDPLKTKLGKQAIIDTLARLGVSSFWRTPKSGDIQMDRDAMQNLAAQHAGDQRVVRLARAIMIVTGTRTVYQTMQDNLIGDRIHPEINLRQASGRWSYTGINLAALGKRGERFHERDVLLPDPGHKILAVDLAQVDMRAVAGLSGDTGYINLFGEGDPHTQIAEMLLGSAEYRQQAKTIGHGWNYGRGVKAISEAYEIDPGIVRKFDREMKSQYPGLVLWREAAEGRAKIGLLDNGFGRKMRADPARAYTQGPALEGQGAARDIMMQGLLRLADAHPEVLGMLRAQVHDEIVLSVPADQVDDVRDAVIAALQFEWEGPGGTVPIEADAAPLGDSWGRVYEKE